MGTEVNPGIAAPKSSRLGWDMDHVWLLRDGTWVLEGEWLRSDRKWFPLRAKVEIVEGQATYHWEGDPGPFGSLELPRERGQGKILPLTVLRDASRWSGHLDVRGARQFLSAHRDDSSWSETVQQRPDGSVEVTGTLAHKGGDLDAWQWTLRAEALDEVWSIPSIVVAEIKVAARAGAPIEQCGLLVGRFEEREIVRQTPVRNADQSEDHFTIDASEQFQANKSLRGSGTEVIGSWHSHPFSPARLSDEDIAFAQDETALYAVVSLMDPQHPRLNIWKVEGGRARLVLLRIRAD